MCWKLPHVVFISNKKTNNDFNWSKLCGGLQKKMVQNVFTLRSCHGANDRKAEEYPKNMLHFIDIEISNCICFVVSYWGNK